MGAHEWKTDSTHRVKEKTRTQLAEATQVAFFLNIIFIFTFLFWFGWITQAKCKRKERERETTSLTIIKAFIQNSSQIWKGFPLSLSRVLLRRFMIWLLSLLTVYSEQHATPFLPQVDFPFHYPRKTSGNTPSLPLPCIPKSLLLLFFV